MRVGGWGVFVGVGLAAVGCTSKVSVEVTNAPPTATILAPFTGDVRQPGEAYTLRGSGSDPTDEPATLVARWFVDGQEPCVAAPPDEAGETRCDIEVPDADAMVVLEVTDRQGSTAQATATLEVAENSPPSAVITAPADGAVLRSDGAVLLEGAVADAESLPPALVVTWSSSLDGLLASPTAEAGGGVTATARLRVGHHILTLSAIDPRAAGASDRVEVDVVAPNAAPSCAITAPVSGSELRFGQPQLWVGSATDADHPSPSLSATWSSDRDGALGVSVPTAGGSVTLPDVALTAGLHVVTLQVQDPEGAVCVASAAVRVQAPPSDPVVVVLPTQPRTDDALTAVVTVPSTDPNGDVVSYLWLWRRDGVVTGETTDRVAPAATAKGERWTVEVRATDGTGESAPATAEVVVENTPPEVVEVAITPQGPIVAGTPLSCAATVRDPDESPTTSYAWTVDGVPVGAGPMWVAAGVRDASVTCTVTAVDGDGATAVGAASVGIDNTAPAVASVQIAPSTPVAGDTLVCSASGLSDAEGDAVSLTFAWTRDGQAAGAGETFSGAIVGGEVLSCTVTPSDGRLSGASLSASVVVGNSAPILAGPTLSPNPPRVGDRVTCAAAATDPDGTAPDLSWSWSLDGVAVGTGETWTVPPGTAVGARLRCVVVADDGEGGVTEGEASVWVADTPPEGLEVALAPNPPRTDDVLVASVQGTDANGEAIAWSYVWTVDGDEVPGVTGPTLDGVAWFDAGETVTVVATASTPSGASSVSTSVRVANTPPSTLSVSLTFTGGDWRNGLTCTVASPATDADGDALVYRFGWDVDGAAAAGSAVSPVEERVDGAGVASRQVWTCTVVADDGSSQGPSASASLIVPYCQTYLPDCTVAASVWSGNGHAYGLMTSWSGWTWDQAAAAAVAAGGHLATLGSWDENEAAFARADPLRWGSNLGPWLGATQAPGGWEPAGGWGWATGESFSFTRWAPGEPNNIGCWQGNEDAMHYFSSSSALWNDHPRGGYCGATGPVFYAVVEFDADCDATGTVDYADDCLP